MDTSIPNAPFPKILAIDFDGTLVEDNFPEIGIIRLDTIERLNQWRADNPNGKVILWTCRTDTALKAAVEFCAEYGIHFDAINDNIDEVKIRYDNNARKVFADEYWDDKAVRI